MKKLVKQYFELVDMEVEMLKHIEYQLNNNYVVDIRTYIKNQLDCYNLQDKVLEKIFNHKWKFILYLIFKGGKNDHE